MEDGIKSVVRVFISGELPFILLRVCEESVLSLVSFAIRNQKNSKIIFSRVLGFGERFTRLVHHILGSGYFWFYHRVIFLVK